MSIQTYINYSKNLNPTIQHKTMDLQLSIQILLTISPIIFIIYIIFPIKPTKPNPKPFPGPSKLPIIGNIHQLILTNPSHPPHHILTHLSQKHGDLMHLQIGQMSTLIVSSPRLAKQVMKTNDLALADRHELLVSRILPKQSIRAIAVKKMVRDVSLL